MRRPTMSTMVRRLSLAAGLVFLAWWLVRQYLDKQQKQTAEYPIPYLAKAPGEGSTAPVKEAETTPDNLRLIEGVGPKIASVLSGAGVVSFAQLAAAEVEELRQMLSDGGVRIAFPDTWPEQAALAAAGKWEDLKRLQSQLVRGRRIEEQE